MDWEGSMGRDSGIKFLACVGVGRLDFVAIINGLVEPATLETGRMILGRVDAFSWTPPILGTDI